MYLLFLKNLILDQEAFYGIMLHPQNIYLLQILEKHKCQKIYLTIFVRASDSVINKMIGLNIYLMNNNDGDKLMAFYPFNYHRATMFVPSYYLCSQKRISQWYGWDGCCIKMGILMYINIDQKPEDCFDVQKSVCV